MAGSQSILLDILGEYPVTPDLYIRPTAPRAAPAANVGWKYRRRYTISNASDRALINHPYAINFGPTNTLVSASKLLASGNDLRVWRDGGEVARTLNTVNSATDCLAWLAIPYLAAGGSMVVDVVYGNSAAGAPPTLTAGIDLPAFDIAATGGGRSTNTSWVYLVDRIAANAGKGGYYLSSGTAQPEVKFAAVPGGWEPVRVLNAADDCWQLPYSSYVATGTKYQGIFNARRARAGALADGPGLGADGLTLKCAAGIVSVTADMRWINLAVGDTNTTPVGKLAILTRNNDAETWLSLYENAALQATEATISSATYTPASPCKELAFATLPNDGVGVDFAARADRYINAAWWSVLTVAVSATVTATQVPRTSAWTPALASPAPDFWHRPEELAGIADGAALASWTDATGNARHAANATGAEQPIVKTNQLNGLPCVRFDGVDDDLTVVGHGLAKPCTIFVVAKLVSASALNGDRLYHASNMYLSIGGTGNNDYLMNGGASLQYSTDTLDSNPHIHAHVFSDTAVSLGAFDGNVVTGNAGTTAPSGNMVYASTGTTGHLPVDVFEVVAFNGALSADAREQVEQYLAAKYALTANITLTTHLLNDADYVYELASEVRAGGGGDAAGVPPYDSVLLGNAKSLSGVGTPRLACKFDEQIAVFCDARKAEVWNLALTGKVADVPIPTVRAVDGLLQPDGSTLEVPSTDWMALPPMVNPLSNPSADTAATGWSRGTVTAGITVNAVSRTTAAFDSDPASFTATISANSSGTGGVVEEIASDYLPLGNRQNVQVGVAIRTANVNIQPTPAFWFYDANQVLIGSRAQQADWTIPAANAWYRHLYAALVPAGAVYCRVGIVARCKTANPTGQYWWDTVAPNDSELALLDASIGGLLLYARWQNRYAYNG